MAKQGVRSSSKRLAGQQGSHWGWALDIAQVIIGGLEIREVSRARPAVDDDISSEADAAAQNCIDRLWQSHKTAKCSVTHIMTNLYINTHNDKSVHKRTEVSFRNAASASVKPQVLLLFRLAFVTRELYYSFRHTVCL